MKEGWSTISQCRSGGTPIHRLKGPEGLRLTIVQVEGPIIFTNISLATETHDNDGLPHALEHLIFLGSEDYPYKGPLDIFASRCFSSTNGMTFGDHTSYVLYTAGPKGTLKMLPIYLDHVLYPVLTDQAYLTEIHHVNGEGKDAGAMYSEIEAGENKPNSRCIQKLLLAAYGNSGYSSEHGGTTENLRNSTNNEKVRRYHKTFYRPENTLIILIGQIDCDEVLEALQPVVDKIKLKKKQQNIEPFIRPWQSSLPPINSTETIRENFPTDSEDAGSIMIGWRGPNILSQGGYHEFNACSILLEYLAETPIAPLRKALVEVENPFASGISIAVYDTVSPLLILLLENVPVERLDEAFSQFKKCLNSITSINLERIKDVTKKQIRQYLSQTEDDPYSVFNEICKKDVVYNLKNEVFEEMANDVQLAKNLLEKNEDFWMTIFERHLKTNFLSVIATPSKELMVRLSEDENKRYQQNRKTLGEDGLKNKQNELVKAMEYNSRKPPSDIYNGLTGVDCEGMKFISLETWSSDGENCPYFPLNELPFYSRVHHVNSHFVYINLLINTSALTKEQRLYLPLFIELLPESPYKLDDIQKDHTSLIADIDVLTNSLSLNIGISKSNRFLVGSFQQTMALFVQCEPEKYEEVVKLIWCILTKTIFTKERTAIIANKIFNSIPDTYQDGDDLSSVHLDDLMFTRDSNFYHCCVMRQKIFLKGIIQKLKNNNYRSIFENLEKLRETLLTKNNIWLHFSANLKNRKYSAAPWRTYSIINSDSDLSVDIKPGAIINDYDFFKGKNRLIRRCRIVGIGGMESNFLKQYSLGLPSLTDTDNLILRVITKYFTQEEGPFWRDIRGAGLTYGYKLIILPSKRVFEYKLTEATDVVQAYIKTRDLINSFLENVHWDEDLFLSAKNSLIYSLVKNESSPAKAVMRSLKNYYIKEDLNSDMETIRKILRITKDEMTRVAKRWLPNLFNPNNNTLVVVCNVSKVDDMKTAFESFGFDKTEIYRVTD